MPMSAEMITILATTPDQLRVFWKVTSRSGVIVRVSNHHENLTVDGELYLASAVEPTELRSAAGLSPDNAEITIPLVTPFTITNLLGGFWRGARVEMQGRDWTNLAAGPSFKRIGYIGEVTVNNFLAQPEFRSLAQILNQPIGDVTQETCRFELGDANCGKNLAAFTFAGTVTAIDATNPNQIFTVSVSQASGYFHKGRITFTSGNNNGLTEEVWDNVTTQVKLFKPMVGDVQVGDAVTLIAGDDKTLATCRDKFANARRFGAEPFLKGREYLFKYPE